MSLDDFKVPLLNRDTFLVELDSGDVYAPNAECLCAIDAERCELEPYSWGGCRGFEWEVGVDLIAIKLGDLTLTRDQAVKMFGEKVIAGARDQVADEVLRNIRGGW